MTGTDDQVQILRWGERRDAVLLMDATGKPFPELMQSLLLKPLGMGGKRLSTAPKRQAQLR